MTQRNHANRTDKTNETHENRRPRRMRKAIAGLCAVTALGFAQQGMASAHEHPRQQVIDVKGFHTHLDLCDNEVGQGMTTFRFSAGDDVEHGLQIARLKNGTTVEQYRATVLADDFVTLLAEASPVGGTDLLTPGTTWQMSTRLEPGTYVMFDPGEATDGTSNVADGAFATITVTDHPESDDGAPSANVNVTITDQGYRMPSQLPRHAVIRVHNGGTQLHGLVLARVNPGFTVEQVEDFILENGDGDGTDNPPATEISGMTFMDVGRTDYVTMDFAPGDYVGLDFFPDLANGGIPHVAEGLMTSFHVS
jgi:hypothetical protein